MLLRQALIWFHKCVWSYFRFLALSAKDVESCGVDMRIA